MVAGPGDKMQCAHAQRKTHDDKFSPGEGVFHHKPGDNCRSRPWFSTFTASRSWIRCQVYRKQAAPQRTVQTESSPANGLHQCPFPHSTFCATVACSTSGLRSELSSALALQWRTGALPWEACQCMMSADRSQLLPVSPWRHVMFMAKTGVYACFQRGWYVQSLWRSKA
jgi:hypothetical protein